MIDTVGTFLGRNIKLKSVLVDSYFNIAQYSKIDQALEKLPPGDIKAICKRYEKNPQFYNDVFDGKVHILPHGCFDRPMPLTNYLGKLNDIRKIFKKNSLINSLAEIFEVVETKKDCIKKANKVSIELNGDKLHIAGYDSNNENMFYSTLYRPIENSKNGKKNLAEPHLLELIKLAKPNRLDIIRE